MMPSLHVVTSDGALKKALVTRLDRALGMNLSHDGQRHPPEPDDIVVSTTTECPAGRAAELAASGVHVIVLSAIPREDERDRYRQAGAEAYLPMSTDVTQLVDAIRHAHSLV